MRNSDAVRICRQFKSYSKVAEDIKPGDRIYAAVLPPPGNTRKLQIKWNSPLVVLEIVNKAMIKIQELDVKNPRTYIAHRSKVRLAKRFGQKDTEYGSSVQIASIATQRNGSAQPRTGRV